MVRKNVCKFIAYEVFADFHLCFWFRSSRSFCDEPRFFIESEPLFLSIFSSLFSSFFSFFFPFHQIGELITSIVSPLKLNLSSPFSLVFGGDENIITLIFGNRERKELWLLKWLSLFLNI